MTDLQIIGQISVFLSILCFIAASCLVYLSHQNFVPMRPKPVPVRQVKVEQIEERQLPGKPN